MCPECDAELTKDETGRVYCEECGWRCSIEDAT